ncbi:MAG TPA: MBL fold metallo-hydrolase [Syntrophomonadaceae bacterium]|nr:MBL fold metallo-hydrolase [Syntrophomonadaceae bacterium]
MIKFMRSDGLRQNYSVSERAYWADDWFTVEEIDNHTFIISEPRFHLQNNSYLLIGDTSALLFDTGSGKRDISPVVYSLTNLPLIVLPSHSHSDHLGSIAKFDRVVLADLPINRKNAQDNIFKPSFIMYCNSPPMPKIPVYKWLHPNEMIDLGNRLLRIIPTPGHSTDSITLLDEQHKLLFTGDFLYAGNLIATLGGSVTDYLKSTQTLITVTKGDEFIFPAHYTTGLKRQNLLDLEEALIEIIAGNVEGKRYFIAKKYPVNNKISFMTTPLKLRNAQSNHGS